MSFKCLIGFHSWDGCKCSKCGKTNQKKHDWSQDCEICSKCGLKSEGYIVIDHPIRKQEGCSHYYRGCTCIYCGRILHSTHNGICTYCGNKRKISQHDYSKDCGICSKCGKTHPHPDSHKWEGCKCTICGKVRDEQHSWYKDCEKCSKCHKTRIDAHLWEGCKCTNCGKTRDDLHDWSMNCEMCSMCHKTRIDAHLWEGCKCTNCGKTRDDLHDWLKDCEKCSRCGKTRNNTHKWEKDCICKICGKVQHDWSKDCEECARCGTIGQHDWNGCKCNRCSKKRDEQHDWDACACKRCSKKRDEQHEWNGCTCKKCYKERDEHHDWSQSCNKCSICGELVNDNHNWEGCRCTKCSVTRDKGHDIEKFVCKKCGQVDDIAHLFSLQNRSKNNSSEIFSTLSEHNAGILIVQLTNGANPNSCLNDGLSAIEVASGFSFLQGVDILLQAGANPNNWKKYPPLNSLLQGSMISDGDKSYCERVIVNMLNKGADPRTTMKDYSGKSGRVHYIMQ